MTQKQRRTIRELYTRFQDPRPWPDVLGRFLPRFDLPANWVAGWISYPNGQGIYVGVAPDGQSHS